MAANKEVDAPRVAVYKCTSCGRDRDRDDLTVKKALFQSLGSRGKWHRSRTVAWLCDECRDADADWNRKPNKGGVPEPPGHQR